MTDLEKLNFIKKHYYLAIEAGKEYQISPVVILAQSAVESGWGISYGARIRKNYFGITAGGTVNKYWNGEWSWNDKKTIKFRIYKSIKDSFFDFARLIRSNYTAAANVSHDYAKYAKAIAYSPYISETNGDNRPAYEKAIIINSKFIIANISSIKAVNPQNNYIGLAVIAGFFIALIKNKFNNNN